jgi:hypothetical protein
MNWPLLALLCTLWILLGKVRGKPLSDAKLSRVLKVLSSNRQHGRTI